MSELERLIATAFKQGPAAEANTLIEEVRVQLREELGAAQSYEVVLDGRGWDYLREVVAPRLAFYLRGKRFHFDRCAPVFLSLFQGDRLYFIHAEDFYRTLRATLGLSEESFAAMARGWEETGRAVAGALPPGDPEPRS